MTNIDKIWNQWQEKVDSYRGDFFFEIQSDPYRRVYFFENTIYKVEFPDCMTTKTERVRDVAGEYDIYKLCSGVSGVPHAIRLLRGESYNALVLERVSGKRFCVDQSSWFEVFRVTAKLSKIVFLLAQRHVCHNDIKAENVIADNDGNIALVDFDQATTGRPFVAIVRSFLGITVGGARVQATVFNIVKMKLKGSLPDILLTVFRRTKRLLFSRSRYHKLPKSTPNLDIRVQRLLRAWQIAQNSDASSPNQRVAYYSVDAFDCHFPGERPWNKRWMVLRNIMSYEGKKVLELGSNMALLSTFLLKDEGAKSALAVDADNSILRSANAVSDVFGVAPIFRCIDFDSPEKWEEVLANFSPDVVFSLNVLNWVEDKRRFLKFLGLFQCLVFEGHDDFTTECERLEGVGYSNFDLICRSERKRPLILCKKTPKPNAA